MNATANSRANVFTVAAALLLTTLAIGCSRSPAPHETVLVPGMTILASNKAGSVRISYVDALTRKYQWEGGSRTIRLIPREERFNYEGQIGDGILGLYDPADTWLFSFRPRLVVQEAERHFASEQEVRKFLIVSRDVMDWVYTDDGLVVGFSRTTERGNQMNVDVWQLMINDAKPEKLDGARPESIKIARDQMP